MERMGRSYPVGSLLKALIDVLSSSVAARALAVAKGLVIAALLSPSEYGVATLVAVVVAYSSFADLGTSTAAGRDLSIAIGRSDAAAQRIAAEHLSALRLVGGVVAGLVALGASWLSGDPWTRVGLRWALLVTIASSVVSAALLAWQVAAQSRPLAKGTLLLALLDAALAVALTSLLGLTGLLIALLAAPTFTALWCASQGAPARPRWPGRKTVQRYFSVGLPWLALALIEHNIVYVDHLLVLGYFGMRELGIYNIALVVADAQRMFALAVGIVLGPRLLQRYGRSDSTVKPLQDITLTPVLALAVVLPWLVVPLYFGAKAGVRAYYPLYADSVPLIGILLAGGMFLGLNNGASSFLLAVGKQGRGASIGLVALLCDIAFASLLVKLGWGLWSVAWASLAAYVLFTTMNLSYIHGHFQPTLSERTVFLARAFGPLAYASGAIAFVDARYPLLSLTTDLVVAMLWSFLFLSPLAWPAVRLIRRLETL